MYFCCIRWFTYFFSYLMASSSHCAVPISYVTVLLSHSVVPLFFLTFYGTILTLRSTNIICDCTFFILASFLFFFLTFYGTSLIKRSINITCVYTFVIFGGSLIFFPHILWYQHHIWLYFGHIRWFSFFFPHILWYQSHIA